MEISTDNLDEFLGTLDECDCDKEDCCEGGCGIGRKCETCGCCECCECEGCIDCCMCEMCFYCGCEKDECEYCNPEDD